MGGRLRHAVGVAGIVAVGLSVACTIERADVRTPSGEPPEADTTRVRKLIEATARAIETGELAGLDTLYAEDVLVYESGRVVARGWAAYRDAHLEPEIRAFSERSLELHDLEVRLSGGSAWVAYGFAFHGRHQGRQVVSQGVATAVLRKAAGRWRIVHLHTSRRPVTGGPAGSGHASDNRAG